MLLKQSNIPTYLPLEDTILLLMVSTGYTTIMAENIDRYAQHQRTNISSVITFNESQIPKYVPLKNSSPMRKICAPLQTPLSPFFFTVLANCCEMPIPLLSTLLDSTCLTYSSGYSANETMEAEAMPSVELMQKCCLAVNLWWQWNVF